MSTNMKELKEALNKLPDELLENFHITHQMWLEEFETKIGLCFRCDEEDTDKYFKLYDLDGAKVLQQFAKELDSDGIKCAIGKLDEEAAENNYAEDMPE